MRIAEVFGNRFENFTSDVEEALRSVKITCFAEEAPRPVNTTYCR
jgi:hypothetical protein